MFFTPSFFGLSPPGFLTLAPPLDIVISNEHIYIRYFRHYTWNKSRFRFKRLFTSLQHLGCCSTFAKLTALAYIAARDFLRFSQVSQRPECLEQSISKHGKSLGISLMMHKLSLYVLEKFIINFSHSFFLTLKKSNHIYTYQPIKMHVVSNLFYKKLHYEIQILHNIALCKY